MAENIHSLKRRIKSAGNIAQIAKAMEMISASKIKKAQYAVENNKPYSLKISEIVNKAISSTDPDKIDHPYLKTNNSDKSLLIVFAPDKGLCGSLPANLMKQFINSLDKKTIIITVGKKIEKFASKNGEVIASFHMGTSLPSYSMIFPLINTINQYYLNGEIKDVNIVFTEFKSIFSYLPTTKLILPLTINKEESSNLEKGQNFSVKYKFEPDAKQILDDLLPYYLEIELYHYILEAYTSEQAARMVAMQNAKNNALDIADFLTLTYNKARQAKITNELLDLSNIQYI